MNTTKFGRALLISGGTPTDVGFQVIADVGFQCSLTEVKLGRQSRKKSEARAARLPRADLENLLQEHLAFLQASAAAFDTGFEAEAKRMAVTLRVLLHDTAQSHSLMGQMKRKERSQWVDTAVPIKKKPLRRARRSR